MVITPPVMPHALIFDCDGTLADTMPAHYRAWCSILEPLGAVFPETQFYAMGGMPTVKIAQLLIEQNRMTADPHVLGEQKEQAFVTQLHQVVPFEKVVSVARAGRGTIPMAVASGGYRDVVHMTLRQIGVFDWFPVIVTAEDTSRHKPEPDVFLEAARRIGAAPSICTVYEDTDLGIEAARRAGMRWVDVRTL